MDDKATKKTSESVEVLGQNELRVKVAELCGWKRNEGNASWPETYWIRPQDRALVTLNELPDYCNDLNACYEFEELLKGVERNRYYDALLEQRTESNPSDVAFGIAHATAEQRCRAFVATMKG